MTLMVLPKGAGSPFFLPLVRLLPGCVLGCYWRSPVPRAQDPPSSIQSCGRAELSVDICRRGGCLLRVLCEAPKALGNRESVQAVSKDQEEGAAGNPRRCGRELLRRARFGCGG